MIDMAKFFILSEAWKSIDNDFGSDANVFNTKDEYTDYLEYALHQLVDLYGEPKEGKVINKDAIYWEFNFPQGHIFKFNIITYN